MAITDELREWKGNINTRLLPDTVLALRSELNCIADRIDAAHRAALEKLAAQVDETSDMREFCGRIEQAANNREDAQLWGVDYTPLPLDADGVPIHIGDVMEWPTTGETFEVVGIGDGTLFYVDGARDFADWTGASTKRHHHEPTVEDVLREFAYGLGVSVADSYIAASAAKLRLAGEGA